jgi:beta-fructofuranosidase
MWECPDFFAVLPGNTGGLDLSAAIPNGAKHVLKMSLDSSDKYMIGVYDLTRDAFVPDTVLDDRRLWSRIDHGSFYASKSFFDSKKGRRILWGWSNETDSPSDDVAKGWAGIHVRKPNLIGYASYGNNDFIDLANQCNIFNQHFYYIRQSRGQFG